MQLSIPGPMVGLGVIWLLGLEGLAAGVVLLQAAMPAAVFNYVFAERNGRSPEQVAGAVLASTVLSMLTLPLLVAGALSLAG